VRAELRTGARIHADLGQGSGYAEAAWSPGRTRLLGTAKGFDLIGKTIAGDLDAVRSLGSDPAWEYVRRRQDQEGSGTKLRRGRFAVLGI
jgi:hypothetical protein